MTRPETPYEAASYDLNQFRERRMSDRRSIARGTADRRNIVEGSNAEVPQQNNELVNTTANAN